MDSVACKMQNNSSSRLCALPKSKQIKEEFKITFIEVMNLLLTEKK